MKKLDFSLSGKVAFVTGGSRGIGHAIAVALADAGADVAVGARTAGAAEKVVAEIRALGRRAVGIAGDLAQVEQIVPMVEAVERELGPVDILVNNAGVNQVEPSLDVTPETWDWLLGVNLRAPFFLAQAVAKGMLERGRGKIINIGSDAGRRGYAEHAAYGTTKGGLLQLTKVLAVEWGPRGIQVNALCPGATWSDMTSPAMNNPDVRESILERGVAGRITDPEEIGAAAVFLASGAADMIIGDALYVDGGSIAR